MQVPIHRYTHIIWDWNGTLLDDAQLCVEILNEILKKFDKPNVSLEQYQQQFDFPVKNYYAGIGFDFKEYSFEQISKDYMKIYNRRRYECRLQLRAVEILQQLKDNGVRQSILSAYKQDMLEEITDYFKLKHFFDKLAGLNDYYAASKVEAGRLLITNGGFERNKTLLIGDTLHDYEAAKDLSVDCLLIPCGHNSIERLRQRDCYVIDSLLQLQELLNSNKKENSHRRLEFS
jgi:phosphoglycolate phosphatase